MAIAFVGSSSGLTTALTEPAHSAGDILIFAAFRDGSLSKPGLPAGYTELESNTTNSAGSILAYRVGDGVAGSLTSTSATGCVCAAYSGVASIGDTAVNTGISILGTYPSLTMTVTDGTSWVVLVEQNRVGSGSGQATTPPAGFTHRVVSSDANDQTGLHDSDGGLSSYTGTSENMAGSSNGWVMYAAELVATASGSTETVTVTDGAMTVAGQTVAANETVPVAAGAAAIAGQAVAVNDTIGVTNGALTITGQTVDVTVGERVVVDAGQITIAGQTVNVVLIGTETVPVTSGSIVITGQTVDVLLTAPVPWKGRASGGGTGPADPRFIAAEKARRDREADLWQRIDDTLHGRQRKEPDAAPAPSERETKPLPVEQGDLIPVGPDFMDALLDAMSQDAVSTLITQTSLPYYDPEEDAAVLLLLS